MSNNNIRDSWHKISPSNKTHDRILSGILRQANNIHGQRSCNMRTIWKLCAPLAACLVVAAIVVIPMLMQNNDVATIQPTTYEGYDYNEDYEQQPEYEPTYEPEPAASEPAPIPAYRAVAQQPRIEEYRTRYNNDEIIGHVMIPGTTIDYLVAQTTDNDFYLHHNIQRQRYAPGAIFLDYLADIHNPGDHNWVLFGHNMARNHKFHMLRHFLNEEFFHANRYIYFSTIHNDYIFEVFSAYVADIEFPYIDPRYDDWEYKINTFARMSRFDAGIQVSANDRILTLSTCDSSSVNQRIVVHAVLIDTSMPPQEGSYSITPAMQHDPLTIYEAYADTSFGRFLPNYVPSHLAFGDARRIVSSDRDSLHINWHAPQVATISWSVNEPDQFFFEILVSTSDREKFDVSLYAIPWMDTVPDDIINYLQHPVFLAEEMSLEVEQARAHITGRGGWEDPQMNFSVMFDDAVITIGSSGVTVEQVWEMIVSILP